MISYTLSAQIGKPRPAKDVDKKDTDKEKPDPLDQRISLDILDGSGKVIRHFPEPEDAESPGEEEAKAEPDEEDEEERGPKGAPLWAGSVAGPKVLPGHYQVKLTVDGASQVQPLEIVPDPRSTATRDELARQFALHSEINALLNEERGA